MNQHSHIALAVACALSATTLQAAEIDAGAILNRYRQDLTPRLNAPAQPLADLPYEMFRGFELVGLPAEAQALAQDYLRPFVGKEVVLKHVVGALERRLQDNGHAFVFEIGKPAAGAPQALPTLKAYKVAFGQVRVNNSSRINPGLAARVLEYGLRRGEPVDRVQLERNSTVLTEVEGIGNRFQMVPGKDIGVTDLQVTIEEGRTIAGQLSLDNSGTQTLGQATLRGDVSLNNRLGWGDVFRFYGLATERSNLMGADASYLATGSGWRLGATVSRFAYGYEVVTAAASNRSTGSANNLSAYGTYPLSRTEYGRHTLRVDLEQGRTLGDAVPNGQPRTNLSEVNIRKAVTSIYGVQALPRDSSASYQVALHLGNARQENPSAALQDAGSAQQMGSYGRLFANGSLSRYFFSESGTTWLATANASLQAANTNLPGSEKMYLGGMNQMRGWNPQAVPADEAFYNELKLELLLSPNNRVGAFYEWAAYRQNRRNYLTSVGGRSVPTDATNTGRIADAGLSWIYQPSPRWAVKAWVAQPVSGHPAVNTVPLTDSRRARGWVGISYFF